MKTGYIEDKSIAELFSIYPFLEDFFNNHGLVVNGNQELTVADYLESIDIDELEDKALDPKSIIEQMNVFIAQMLSFIGEDKDQVQTITIHSGQNKSGQPEDFTDLTISKGEIICIVGPTGSGKSRLLADIEWVAQKDTPTKRQILINSATPDSKYRFSASEKLVAQLSQNMNFVMDLSVYEFIKLHAESRMVENSEEIITRIIEQANNLAGEKFDPETPITGLSGGQSRALMIADTAILSKSPIILIDEIENAGIDRKQALQLLLSEEKIVLMATHDPMLALLGDKRIVIRNGGIHKIIKTTNEERSLLGEMEALDQRIQNMRNKLRHGEILKNV